MLAGYPPIGICGGAQEGKTSTARLIVSIGAELGLKCEIYGISDYLLSIYNGYRVSIGLKPITAEEVPFHRGHFTPWVESNSHKDPFFPLMPTIQAVAGAPFDVVPLVTGMRLPPEFIFLFMAGGIITETWTSSETLEARVHPDIMAAIRDDTMEPRAAQTRQVFRELIPCRFDNNGTPAQLEEQIRNFLRYGYLPLIPK